jgi:hypothetical protein
MARYPRKTRGTPGKALLTWLFVGGVATWGVWNYISLQHTMLADGRSSKPAPGGTMQWVESAAAQPPADPFTVDSPPPGVEDDPRGQAAKPPMSPQEALALVDSGTRALNAGNILSGRDQLNQSLPGIPDEAQDGAVRDRLAGINAPIFLGRDVLDGDPYVQMIQVAAGDTFLKLSHRYKVPAEYLEGINPQLTPRNLKPGAGIKVAFGPFHARVVKHASRLDLYARDMYVQSFAVSFDDGNFLPPGLYHVASGGRIALAGAAGPSIAGRRWVMCEGISDGDGEAVAACIYGSAGPRATGSTTLSGVRCSDDLMLRLYNTLVERDSLLRVDP